MDSLTDCGPRTDSAFTSWVNCVSYLTSNESQFSHQKKKGNRKIFAHNSETQINWKKACESLSPVQAEELYLIAVTVDLMITATKITHSSVLAWRVPGTAEPGRV